MVQSGVGQFSINVKSNLDDFYGKLSRTQKSLNELLSQRTKLEIDSKQLDQLRDKGQRIAAEMRELRQQKTEIKLGMREVENADQELKNLDKRIASLNAQKLAVEADIQPIRTTNVELNKVNNKIDSINNKKVEVDFSKMAGGVDAINDKIMSVVKALSGIAVTGSGAIAKVLKDSVNEASDLEQNVGGVEKLYGDSSKKVVEDSKKSFKETGMSMNDYLQQATTLSAALIKGFEDSTTTEVDNSPAIEALKKKKDDLSQQIKDLQYENQSDSNNSSKKDKRTQEEIKNRKNSILELKKQRDELDKEINATPKKTQNQTGGMSREEAQKKAADYINKALIDMSDNANVFNTNMEDITNAYSGVTRGIFTMIDNLRLGYAGTQKGAIDLVNDYGGLDTKISDISEVTFPRFIDAVHNAQEAMKISGTTAKEAAETYSGSFKQLEASWKDFLATGDSTSLESSLPVYLDNLDKKLEELTPKLIASFKKMAKELPAKLKPILDNLTKILKEALDGVFGDKFTSNFVEGMKPFGDLLKWVTDLGKNYFGDGKNDLSWIGKAIPDLIKLVIGLKVISGGLKVLDFFGKFKMPSFKLFGKGGGLDDLKTVSVEELKDLGLKLLTVAGISANIYLAAKALEEVKNVGDLSGIYEKLLSIGTAVAGMGLIQIGINKLYEITGGNEVMGFLAIAGIAGDIYLMAKALEEVGNIDSDFGSLQSKIGQIALVVVEIGALASVVGIAVDTGVGAVVLASGLIALLGIAGTLYLLGLAVSKVGEMSLDSDSINNSLNVIMETISKITDFNADDSLIEKISGFFKSLTDSAIINKFVQMGENLKQLQDLELDSDSVKNTLTIIKDSINTVTDSSFFDNMADMFNNIGSNDNMDNAINTIGEYSKIAEQLKFIQDYNLSADSVSSQLKIIKDAIVSISSFSTDKINNNLTGMADALSNIINELRGEFPYEFGRLGELLAKKVTENFDLNLNLRGSFINQLKKLDEFSGEGLGVRLANSINTGISNNLTIGDTIISAIESALSKDYSTDVTVNINEVKKETKKRNNKKKVSAGGGLITSDNTMLMDSPELPILNNGEYVVPKKIVNTLGVPFFEKLRSGNFFPTLSTLGQNISETTSSIVNNVYNNNYSDNKNYNVYTANAPTDMIIANRRVR